MRVTYFVILTFRRPEIQYLFPRVFLIKLVISRMATILGLVYNKILDAITVHTHTNKHTTRMIDLPLGGPIRVHCSR